MKASETFSKKELNMILNTLGEYQAKWIKALQKYDKDLPVMLEVLVDDPPGYGWGVDAFLKTLRLGPYGVKPRYLKLSGETE